MYTLYHLHAGYYRGADRSPLSSELLCDSNASKQISASRWKPDKELIGENTPPCRNEGVRRSHRHLLIAAISTLIHDAVRKFDDVRSVLSNHDKAFVVESSHERGPSLGQSSRTQCIYALINAPVNKAATLCNRCSICVIYGAKLGPTRWLRTRTNSSSAAELSMFLQPHSRHWES